MDQYSSASHVPLSTQPVAESPAPVKKRRHRWIWFVVLLLFGLLFYWVILHQQKSHAAAMGGGRRMGAGTVPVTVATAHTG